MLENVKPLIFVLALAAPAFYLGRRIVGSTIANREFAVWRNAWFAVTIAAFLCTNFFVFATMAVMVCIYAHSVRAATVSLYFILLFAAPVVKVLIPGFGGINTLMEINYARVLVIVLLIPILLTGGISRQNVRAFAAPDWLIISFVLLTSALEFRNSEVTNVLRVTTVQMLDVLIPYFAFSRSVTSMAEFRKVCIAVVIGLLPNAFIAVFETIKYWHVYLGVVDSWGGLVLSPYIARSGFLRAFASTQGSITLGFILMVAIGCMLVVRHTMLSRRTERIALAMLAAGLVASLSRGPWVGTGVLLVVYVATGPNAATNLGKLAAIGIVTMAALLLTPVGQTLLDFLPFVGTVDVGTVEYRKQLFESALIVIERNLWFGSVDFRLAPEMQELVQGQGIIDIVNHYLKLALDYGLLGLGCFLVFFATILLGLRRVLKFSTFRNSEFNICTRAAMATLVAILVTLGTVSSVDFIPYVYWSFGGLCVALVRIAYKERAAVARGAYASQIAV
jgi:hypothetical protein